MIGYSCPCCQAVHSACPEGCRRCRADLSLLQKVELDRQRLLDEGVRAFESGLWWQAWSHFHHAAQYYDDAITDRYLKLCQLLSLQR